MPVDYSLIGQAAAPGVLQQSMGNVMQGAAEMNQLKIQKAQMEDFMQQREEQKEMKHAYAFNEDGSVNYEQTIDNMRKINPLAAAQTQQQFQQQAMQRQQMKDQLMTDMSTEANNIMTRYEQIKSTQGEQAARAVIAPMARQLEQGYRQRATSMGLPMGKPQDESDEQVISGLQYFQMKYKDYAKQQQEKQKAEEEAKKPTSQVGKIEEDFRKGRISKEERDQAVKKETTWRPLMSGGFGQPDSGTNSSPADKKPKSVLDKPGVTAAVKDYLLSGRRPAQMYYGIVMQGVEEMAKIAGTSVDDLLSSSADVKAQVMSLKVLENRAQNMERAENVLGQEIPVVEDAIKKIDLPSNPILAKAKIAKMRLEGDPAITRLDLAAENVFNEFNGIVTGNPGALNVSDVQNAKDQYHKAQTPQQMAAAMDMMKNMINRAKVANEKSRTEAKERISAGLGKATSRKDDSIGHPSDIQDLLKKYGK